MSSINTPLTLQEFFHLLPYCIEHHKSNEEPYPSINECNTDRLESSLIAAFQTFDGSFLYKGFRLKAAVFFYCMIKNHPLNNGNKRMACLSLAYLADKNGYRLLIPADKFMGIAKIVANSNESERDIIINELHNIFNKYIKS